MRQRVREALFSVVKGGTGLCTFFCRTGRLLICLGKGRTREKWLNRGREGEKRMQGQGEEEMEVPPLRRE